MNDQEIVKQKLSEWKEHLIGNYLPTIDGNSIQGTLSTLLLDLAIYESYEAICKPDRQSPLATRLFGNFTAFNYIQMQALRIRRLCESQSQNDGVKDVSIYSLRRICDEVKQNKRHLTHDNICFAHNIPAIDEIRRQFNEDTSGWGGSFSADTTVANNMHAMLDKICDQNGLKKFILNNLDKRLLIDKNPQLRDIMNFVNKYIAHSASAQSREQISQDLKLDMPKMKKVIQDITEAFYCLNLLITNNNTSLISTGWQSQLMNLSDEQKAIVHQTFTQIHHECEAWKQNGYKLIRG